MNRCACIAALLLAVAAARAEDTCVVWRPAEAWFPSLGWRQPVELRSASSLVDRAAGGLHAAFYNCHFYTLLHVKQRAGGDWLSYLVQPRIETLTEGKLQAWGVRPLRAGEAAEEGDVVLAVRAGGVPSLTHSALVREVDGAGRVRTVRQKFDARHPVVDVSWEEFRTLYAGMHPWRVEVWRQELPGDRASL